MRKIQGDLIYLIISGRLEKVKEEKNENAKRIWLCLQIVRKPA